MAAGIPTDPTAIRNWLGLKIDKPIASLDPSLKGKVMTSTSVLDTSLIDRGMLKVKLKFN